VLHNVTNASDLFSFFIFISRVNVILLSRYSVSVRLKSSSMPQSSTATCSSCFQTERVHGSAFSDQTSFFIYSTGSFPNIRCFDLLSHLSVELLQPLDFVAGL
jgi:hypothetical protein